MLGFHVNVTEEVAAGFTVSVTPTVFEVVPTAATVIAPLYVPGFKPAVLTLADKVPVLEPEPGVTDSQDVLSLAVQLSVPPVFVIDTF